MRNFKYGVEIKLEIGKNSKAAIDVRNIFLTNLGMHEHSTDFNEKPIKFWTAETDKLKVIKANFTHPLKSQVKSITELFPNQMMNQHPLALSQSELHPVSEFIQCTHTELTPANPQISICYQTNSE